VAPTLLPLLWPIGLCWQAPRAPSRRAGTGVKRKMPSGRGQPPQSLRAIYPKVSENWMNQKKLNAWGLRRRQNRMKGSEGCPRGIVASAETSRPACGSVKRRLGDGRLLPVVYLGFAPSPRPAALTLPPEGPVLRCRRTRPLRMRAELGGMVHPADSAVARSWCRRIERSAGARAVLSVGAGLRACPNDSTTPRAHRRRWATTEGCPYGMARR